MLGTRGRTRAQDQQLHPGETEPAADLARCENTSDGVNIENAGVRPGAGVNIMKTLVGQFPTELYTHI